MNEPIPTRISEKEAQLFGQITGQDDDAARRLYRKYRLELFRFGVDVLRDQGLAEEMVQETFIKFCQQARSYDASRGPVRAWLFTIAKSAAIDIARRPSSRPFLPVEDFQLPPQYDSVDQALTVLTVEEALHKLPSIYGDVMRLVRDGFTPSEIAERLDIPVGTVKSRIAKAANTLRAELASLQSFDDAPSQTLPDSVDQIDDSPAHEGDALDWLHEQGKRRAKSVPDFDLDATLRKLRAARTAAAYAHTDQAAHPARSTGRPRYHSARDLTPREKEVLRRIVAGQSTSQMSREMNIATSTVRAHVKNVLTKLGAHSRLQAAALAARENLLSDHTV